MTATDIPASTDVAELMRVDFAAVDRKDLAAMQALWHPRAEARFIALGEELDRDGVTAFFRELFTAMDPFTFETIRVHADGQTSIGEWLLTGTFCGGPWNGFEPTGGQVVLAGIDVMEWEDGLMRRNTVYFDGAAAARQLGLLPPEGSAVERGMTAAFNGVQRLRARLGRI